MSLDIEDDKNGKVNETYDESDLHPSKLKRIGKVLGKFFNFEQNDKGTKRTIDKVIFALFFSNVYKEINTCLLLVNIFIIV